MKICTLFYPVCAATRAEDKKAAYDTLPTAMDQLSLLSESLNYDFASKGMDEPLTDEELAGIVGMQSMRDCECSPGGGIRPCATSCALPDTGC
jgi:hypothetical protein